MGQTLSGLTDESSAAVNERTVLLDEHELNSLFTKKCLTQLKQIETFSIKANLNISDLNQDKVIDRKEFKTFLSLPNDIDDDLVTLIFNFVVSLADFPLLSEKNNSTLNVVKLLKAINLLDSARFNSIFKQELSYADVIMTSLSLSTDRLVDFTQEKIEKSNAAEPHGTKPIKATIINNKLSWGSIDYYRKVKFNELEILAKDLCLFLAFCLAISTISIEENHYASLSQFHANFDSKNWKAYKKIALSMVRSVDYSVTAVDSEQKLKVTSIVATLKSTFPFVLAPLSHILNPLLLMPHSPTTELFESHTGSTIIVNQFTLSQLATFLPVELCYSKMRKLYVGKDYGFSMRSFESKVMKWNAPTLLFVSGSRLNPSKKKLSKGAEEFLTEEYPRFKPSAAIDKYGVGSEKLTFGVFVSQPWKASNKETFGDDKTLIFQLSPQQQLFRSSNFISKKFVYFSTFNNGGIGFGCDIPSSKNGDKKYQPGNVSLLIDGGLEFCAFRHIGPGGSFQTGSAYTEEYPEYEDKFVISDLEVYGVGSDKEIQEQVKQWEWEKKEAEARQRVNLKNIGEERAFLEMAGLVGQGGSGGSV